MGGSVDVVTDSITITQDFFTHFLQYGINIL